MEAASLCSNEYSRSGYLTSVLAQSLPDPRLGVVISDYYEFCVSKIDLLKSHCAFRGKDVLILGTEECMLPALLIGKAIEDEKDVKSIKCHATTRSPIGVSKLPGYPIETGFRVHSLYDFRRDTFIYNLQSYDVAVIISDAKGAYARGLFELSMILKEFGCQEILCLADLVFYNNWSDSEHIVYFDDDNDYMQEDSISINLNNARISVLTATAALVMTS